MAPYDSGPVVRFQTGGIFSSQRPNYLAQNQPICPDGYERHPVGSNPIAEITYCLKIGTLNQETKNIIPLGYGNSLTNLIDLYKIHNQNGSNIGISVEPLKSKDYYDQALDLSIKTISNISLQNCYLKKWFRQQESYINIKNNNITKNIDTTFSSSYSLILIFSLLSIICLICLICVILFIVITWKPKIYLNMKKFNIVIIAVTNTIKVTIIVETK